MKKTLLTLLILIQFGFVNANNIQVSNISLAGNTINFSLSWENSWKDTINHDAAWVFIKYRYPNPNWKHAILQTNGHVAPSGCIIESTSDGIGVYIYRSGGLGNNNFQGVQLKWNLAANGIIFTDSIQIKVCAIEMVYVPQGSFYIGDGIATGSFRQAANNTPVLISPTAAIVKCGSTQFDDAQLSGAGILVDGDGGIDSQGATTVNNPNYPTGYKAFYCMKYETSQGQYADFLNSLTAAQFANRYYVFNLLRYTLGGSWPNIIASVPERAMNHTSWMDLCAYADWVGLRPMTELEFEKACRGPLSPVAGEYAWGNTSIFNTAHILSNNGAANELVANQGQGVGNASYEITDGSIDGPLRCGIFAAGAVNKTRVETGSTFWGIMEMSGNMWERVVNLGSNAGRNYTGLHGDGVLDEYGNATVANWPGMVSGAITAANGSGFRGGTYYLPSSYLNLSNRFYASDALLVRNGDFGCRFVRTAP